MTAERKRESTKLTSDWLKVCVSGCDWIKNEMSWWGLEIAGKLCSWLRWQTQRKKLPERTFAKLHENAIYT